MPDLQKKIITIERNNDGGELVLRTFRSEFAISNLNRAFDGLRRIETRWTRSESDRLSA